MGSSRQLGMDQNKALVDNKGLYHYHGKPIGLFKISKPTHIGFAVDGIVIHDVGESDRPSYVLKSGYRPTSPQGLYDGRFVQDWKYAVGPDNLDECNGGVIDANYVYFATDSFSFYPRSNWENASVDFLRRGPRGRNRRPPISGGTLDKAAAELGVSESQLRDAVGPPPPDTRNAAKVLGISEELVAALRRIRPRQTSSMQDIAVAPYLVM